ncbi:thymidine phosphorylase [Methanocaldococcus villosus KIN24-T80]|uniref:AMP phosphorylase n=1 Tax=Methanocaldococcus villosus KIN24-T80 TaxID=1069083 RepID=N6VX49_9EURY|nr:AMP phosphorylase [Methanocaldococcus villosus]ENN95687.1 thymidine phosphorylase [Methanocaldococcus villosus KIN24-T80]
MLFLKAKILDIDLENIVLINYDDLKNSQYFSQDRVVIEYKNKEIIAFLYSSKDLINSGEIGLPKKIADELKVKEGDIVNVSHADKPISIQYIKKKMDGNKLKKEEIYTIIDEIVDNNLSNIEISAFITALYINGMDIEEITSMTIRMAETGEMIKWEGQVYDVHSIGGVPGNKYALITVPIIAYTGLKIPKTSSRAITSAAGTADIVEVLTRVNLKVEEIKRVVKETNGCLVWGGALELAPADDITITVERALNIDPKPLLLSSVLSKKLAMGINKLLIDIPLGAKVKNMDEASSLARNFIELGDRLNIYVDCAITYGEQPIGRAIGPALEAKEALLALEDYKKAPNSLVEKAISLSGILLEMGGIAPKGEGKDLAEDILATGKAHDKFMEIIVAQGGEEKTSDEIEVGKYYTDILSPIDGYVTKISNEKITKIAKTAGAPNDKKAGVYLNVKVGNKVEKNDVLFTIYSDSKERLEKAVKLSRLLMPVKVEGMLLKRITRF